MRAVLLIVAGHVQGVGFRAWTRRAARDLGLKGWVRNEADGSVSVHAEGDAEDLDRFMTACHRGPPGAAVDRVTVNDATPEGFPGFSQRCASCSLSDPTRHGRP